MNSFLGVWGIITLSYLIGMGVRVGLDYINNQMEHKGLRLCLYIFIALIVGQIAIWMTCQLQFDMAQRLDELPQEGSNQSFKMFSFYFGSFVQGVILGMAFEEWTKKILKKAKQKPESTSLAQQS